jgi:hypothetical protein
VARPIVPLLKLVQERRFDATNKRHRAKLLEDDSLREFVAGNPGASARLRMLAECQERYRRVSRSSTVTVWEARQFEAGVRRLDDEGEPLPLVSSDGGGFRCWSYVRRCDAHANRQSSLTDI